MTPTPNPAHPELVEGLSFSTHRRKKVQPFDKLRVVGLWGEGV